MPDLITDNPTALQLLMTDDLYIIQEILATPEITEVKPTDPSQIQSPVVESTRLKDFSYLGENNKYFLILVDDKTHKQLNATHKEMLLKVIQAKGLELRDIAILNLDQHPGATFNDLKDFFVNNKIVLFGIPPQQIGLPAISLNKPEKYLNVKVLVTYNLEEMKNEVEKKRDFWAVMKPF